MFFVDLNALEICNIGARGDDDIFCFNSLPGNINFAGAKNFPRSPKRRNFVFLQQKINALGVAINGFLLEAHHLCEIKCG